MINKVKLKTDLSKLLVGGKIITKDTIEVTLKLDRNNVIEISEKSSKPVKKTVVKKVEEVTEEEGDNSEEEGEEESIKKK